MSRPKKAVVDYFPHYVTHGKTMFTIEGKFGNDGYAFWFKLLEMLGSTENHFIDCNDFSTWEFLLAKTRLNGETADNILAMLANCGSIDAELWENRIIWSEHFVENLSTVYLRRRVSVYTKEDVMGLCIQKPHSTTQCVVKNPQSKVKESKVNKPTNPKPKKVKTFIPDDFAISQQVREWARKEGYEPYLEAHLSYFIDYARAGGVQTIDWDAKFRNAIRGDWGEIREKAQRKGNNGSPSKPKKCTNHADRAATWINFYGQDLCDECHAKVVQIRQKSMQREATA